MTRVRVTADVDANDADAVVKELLRHSTDISIKPLGNPSPTAGKKKRVRPNSYFSTAPCSHCGRKLRQLVNKDIQHHYFPRGSKTTCPGSRKPPHGTKTPQRDPKGRFAGVPTNQGERIL